MSKKYNKTNIKAPRNTNEYSKQYMKQYREKHKDFASKANERCKRNHRLKRIQVYEHYGNKCACCGETRYEFLTIDHINNDGEQQRKSIPQQNNNAYHWIIKNSFPDDLQILCHNCHMSKHYYGYCPHQENKPNNLNIDELDGSLRC